MEICKAQFEVSRPRSAILHFRKHIEAYKASAIATSTPELEYTTELARLFSNFADLFQQAVDVGMKASKTQHPGHYYYEAALLTRECRRLSEQTDTESDVIRLLTKARDCFEEWSCIRHQHLLSIMIAEEYLHIRDFNQAIALWSSVLPLYKQEDWSRLVDSLVKKLQSACPTFSQDDTSGGEHTVNRFEKNLVAHDFKLPSSPKNNFPIAIHVDMPVQAVQRQQFEIRCTISNWHQEGIFFEIQLTKCEAFACCGHRSVNLPIPPGDKHTQEYVMYPLACGKIEAPKISVRIHQNSLDGAVQQIKMDHLIHNAPKIITIMPRSLKVSA